MTTVDDNFDSILKKFKKHKIDSYRVAELLGDDYIFTDLGGDTTDKRYISLIECGTMLGFSRKENPEGGSIYNLRSSNFCRQRICPMCQFRKAEKMFVNMLEVCKALENDYRFIHVVLTIKNPKTDEELTEAIKLLYKAFGIMIRYSKPKKAFKGILRCLEVSYNYEENSFHPHLHCLVAVKPSYFNDTKVYISQQELRELWTKAINKAIQKEGSKAKFARSEHLLQCSVRACKKGDYKGVAEVCKYCVKPLDLDKSENVYQNKRVLLTLWHTLKGARFVQKYGVIKEQFKALGLEAETAEADDNDIIYYSWGGEDYERIETI